VVLAGKVIECKRFFHAARARSNGSDQFRSCSLKKHACTVYYMTETSQVWLVYNTSYIYPQRANAVIKVIYEEHPTLSAIAVHRHLLPTCPVAAFLFERLISGLGRSLPSLPRSRLGILPLLPNARRTCLDDVLHSIPVHLDTGILDIQPNASRLLDPIHRSLAGVTDLGRGGFGARGEVRTDEEPGEEPGERGQVDDVEDDGECLAGRVETRDVLVFLCEVGLARDGVGRGGGDRVRVGDEEREESRGAADEELCDLHRREGLLDRFRDSDGE
jgi:hypothetical protein